jgi:long-chain acyl-CoA synthetase
LWQAYRQRSLAFPERVAVRTQRGTLTFAELYEASDLAARAYRRLGLPEGTFVALGAANSLAFLPALLGLWRHSATVGLVSPANGPSELGAIDRHAPPYAYLVSSTIAEGWSRTVGAGIVPLEPDVAGERFCLLLSEEGRARVPVADTALIKFTSGSTGEPKGVALTASNVLAEGSAITESLALTPDDAVLAPVPLTHSYGFDLGGLATLESGATLVLTDTFIGRRVIADLAEGRCSMFLGVPAMYRILVDTPLRVVPSLRSMRYLLSCTAPLSPALISAFHHRFDASICQHYGSSEAGAVTTHVPAVVLDKPDSVGRPMQNVVLRIVDADGRELPQGAEGEVVVQGPAVAQRYVMGASDDRPLGDGTVRMGDRGILDPDGFLFLRGRMDDVINVGGFKVSPLEVVQVLERFEPVREAAVTAARDSHGEEVIYAAVTLRHPAAETEILEFCRSQLAEYKVPRRIDIREALPRGPSGKIRLRPEDVPS